MPQRKDADMAVPESEVDRAEEQLLEEEEDMGVLRLTRLQVALKEKRIVESEG